MLGVRQVLEAVEAEGYELLSAEVSFLRTYRAANRIILGMAAKDGMEYRVVGSALVQADGSGEIVSLEFEPHRIIGRPDVVSDPFVGLS